MRERAREGARKRERESESESESERENELMSPPALTDISKRCNCSAA